MKTIRSIAAAFSMYSRIPMPHFDINEKDAKGAIAFLPLVGAVIAAVMHFALRFLKGFGIPAFVITMVLIAIPIALTGGFHIDGYLDTADAAGSYRPTEKKLEILKDPHIGAAAVISFALCLLLMMAGLGVIIDSNKATFSMPAVFVISRALCAITSRYMKKARPGGLLDTETREAGKLGMIIPVVFLVAAVVLSAFDGISYACVITASFTIFTILYAHFVRKSFGGVTGDTAGYYVVAGEVISIDAIAALTVLMGFFGGA